MSIRHAETTERDRATSQIEAPQGLSYEVDGSMEPDGERWARWFGWVVLVLAPLLAYSNSFHVPFVFDGFNYIVEKAWIADVWSGEPEKVDRFFAEAQTRPLVYLSFALDYKTSEFVTRHDAKPTGHYVPVWHATSLAIHIIAGLALYGIARRGFRAPRLGGWFNRSAERIALVVALLWVVHPLDTQSVTYLYQRHESLMGMFYLLTLYLFTRFADSTPLAVGGWAWCWGAASVLACLCGMGSKEVMITAPLVVLWYDRVFVAESWYDLMWRRGAYHLALFATLALLAHLMSFTAPDYAKAGILDTSRITPQEYALSQLGVVRRYMRLAVLPTGLNIDYAWRKPATWPMAKEFPYIDSWPTEVDRWAIIFPAIYVGAFAYFTLLAMFKSPPLGFLAGSFLLILAPTSSIAPIIDMCFEHRMYVPLAPFLSLLVVAADVGLDKLFKLTRAEQHGVTMKTVVVVLLATALICLTYRRNFDYRSNLVLWDDAQQKAPENQRAKYNHGVYLQIEGSPESMDRAIEQYYATLKLDKTYSSAHLNLANIYLYRNELPQAVEHYLKLLGLEPTHSEGRYGLADAYYRQKRMHEAKAVLESLLLAEPDNANAIALLPKVLEALSQPAATPTGTMPSPHPAP